MESVTTMMEENKASINGIQDKIVDWSPTSSDVQVKLDIEPYVKHFGLDRSY
jgi:hypothetical protein